MVALWRGIADEIPGDGYGVADADELWQLVRRRGFRLPSSRHRLLQRDRLLPAFKHRARRLGGGARAMQAPTSYGVLKRKSPARLEPGFALAMSQSSASVERRFALWESF